MTNIVNTAILVTTLLSTNVVMLPPSEGFSEREFKTNIVQTTTYEFTVNTNRLKFTQVQTNSTIGMYLPIVTTNFIPAHYKEGMGVVPNK
jgi:hypothetical protein